MRKWLPLSLKILVSVGLFAYLITQTGSAAVFERIASIEISTVMGFVFLLGLQILAAGARWLSVIRAIGCRVPYQTLVRIFYIGMFFNQALPGGVGGDAMRTFLLTREGLRMGRAITSVLIERATAVTGLILLLVLAQPFILQKIDESSKWVLVGVTGVVVAGLVGSLTCLMLLDRMPSWLFGSRLLKGLTLMAADMRTVFLSLGPLSRALLWALSGHLIVTSYFYLVARGMHIPISMIDCLALVPIVLLVTLVPVSIGGWGVRETAMIIVFGWVGVPDESALALSVTLGGLVLAASLPGGVVWLFARHRHTPPV